MFRTSAVLQPWQSVELPGTTTSGNLNNGTYTITVSLGSLSFDSGYTGEFSFVNGTSGNGNGLTVQLILPPDRADGQHGLRRHSTSIV